ncbi:hypothetical protein [Lentzea sp.]|uniref:hypothetical protein n=1 Tax=Lentzea sp. TaxID=56099 RepID=UPI002BDA7128|nr:hypothetical protein [Lentzea sp.]HUQ59923.1 hypothetical protein [Lentzea sp.]
MKKQAYAVAAIVDSIAATVPRTKNVRKVTKTSWAGDVALLGASRFVLKGRAARVASAGVMPTCAAAQWLIHTGFARRGAPS